MIDRRNARPPHVAVGGELALGAVLVTGVVLVFVSDVAAVGSGWLTGSSLHLLGFSKAATFFGHLLGNLGDPARGWVSRPLPHFPAALFYVLVALVLAPIVTGAVVATRLVRHLWQDDVDDGFAKRGAVAATAGEKAVRSRAPQTRPGADPKTAALSELGYPLGRSRRPEGVELWASWEESMMLVAPTGAGKTMRVLAPILRQHPGPAFATSTKPDLYEVAVAARKRVGPVFVLDPDDVAPAADPVRWSPVTGCTDTRVAERRASALVAANGEASDTRAGAFFRQSGVAVLASYLHAAALGGASMADVIRWAARPTDPAPRRLLARHGDPTIDWAARLHEHTSGAEETTSGVTRTVDLALACFRHSEVLDLCAVDPDEGFDFDYQLGEGATVFALGKDRSAGNGGVGALITAFADEYFLAAELRASRQRGRRRLDPPLLAALDEAPSIVPLPGLPALVADGRGRGITVITVMQSFSQAVERWGQSAAETMRNAMTITAVFGGLGVAKDLRELEDLCGTGRVVSHSFTEGVGDRRSSIAAQWREEKVMTMADIRALRPGELLLLWGNLPPVLAYAPGVWERPDAKQVAAEKAAAEKENDDARAKRR